MYVDPIFHLPAGWTFSEGYHGKHKKMELSLPFNNTDPFRPLFFDFLLGGPPASVCLKLHLSPIQTCNSAVGEEAINRKEIPCTFLSESFGTVFCRSILKDSLLVEGEI